MQSKAGKDEEMMIEVMRRSELQTPPGFASTASKNKEPGFASTVSKRSVYDGMSVEGIKSPKRPTSILK